MWIKLKVLINNYILKISLKLVLKYKVSKNKNNWNDNKNMVDSNYNNERNDIYIMKINEESW